MSRPRVNPVDAAKSDFRREIRVQRARLDMTQDQLGDSIGVCRSQISKLLADPDSIKVGRLRGIVAAIDPDPAVVLALLGYSKRQIENFKGGKR